MATIKFSNFNHIFRHRLVAAGICLASYGCTTTGHQTFNSNDLAGDEVHPKEVHSTLEVESSGEKDKAAEQVVQKLDKELTDLQCGTLDSLPKTIKFVGQGSPNVSSGKFVDSKGALVVSIMLSPKDSNKFYMINSDNKVVLIGVKSVQSTSRQVDLYDCDQNRVGAIKQDVEKSFLSAEASYQALDANGDMLFQSEKLNEGSSIISVTDMQNEKLAALRVERSIKNFEAVLATQIAQTQQLLMLTTLKAYSESNN